MPKCLGYSAAKIGWILHPHGKHSGRMRQANEIRIHQLGSLTQNTGSQHFQFDKSQGAVAKTHNLYRKLMLMQEQQVAQQHRESSVSREGDHLPARKSKLCPDRLRHRVRHRSMVKGTEQTSLAVHGKVASCPDGWRTDIARKNRIIGSQLIHDFRHILGMHRIPATRSHSQFIQPLSWCLIVADKPLQVTIVFLIIQERQQSVKGRFYVPDYSEIQSRPTS